MADNVEITAGTGTSVATDDVGGVHYQRIKLDLGGDGAASPLVRGAQTAANSIPVTIATDDVLESLLDGIEGLLTTIDADTGNMDTSLNAIEASVAAMDTDLTTIIGHLDGVETLITSTNTKLDTVIGHVDGIETLIGTTNTNTGNAATSLGVMDDWDNGASDGASVSGDVAHDTADAGEPVKIGGKALDVGATPTAVTAGDRVNGAFLRDGVQLVLGGSFNVISKNLNITDADGAQTDAAIITVSAGTAIVVTKVAVMADGANSGDVAVRIGFGTANVPAVDSNGIIFAHPGIKPGSGDSEGNGSGIIGIGASNEDLRVTCEDPAGGAIDIIVTYFTIAIG